MQRLTIALLTLLAGTSNLQALTPRSTESTARDKEYAECMKLSEKLMLPEGINEDNRHEFCFDRIEVGFDWYSDMVSYYED